MTDRLIAIVVAACFAGLAACSPSEPPAAPPEPAATAGPAAGQTPVPEAVRAVVLTAQPTMTISDAVLKTRDGRRYYDVEGRLPDGFEIELDLLETPGGWRVVEIQRDIPRTAVPAAVTAATTEARSGFTPVRVIESTQAEDGAVIYELFADGQPATPALEVRVKDGATEVLKEVWPH